MVDGRVFMDIVLLLLVPISYSHILEALCDQSLVLFLKKTVTVSLEIQKQILIFKHEEFN